MHFCSGAHVYPWVFLAYAHSRKGRTICAWNRCDIHIFLLSCRAIPSGSFFSLTFSSLSSIPLSFDPCSENWLQNARVIMIMRCFEIEIYKGEGSPFYDGFLFPSFLELSSVLLYFFFFFCSLYVCVPCVIFFFSSSLFHINTYVTRLFPRVVRSCRILLPNFGHSTNRGQRLPVVHHNEEKKIDWP